MTTSATKNDNDDITPPSTNGALADGLTLVRALLTPLIMFVLIKAWSPTPDDPMGYISLNLSLVLLASILFAIAAATDILDDAIGGNEHNKNRLLGWFDDGADTILISGTLAALMWVTFNAGFLHWSFFVPAAVLIGIGILVAVFKSGAQETKLDDLKSALAMLGTCILVAAPWLSSFTDTLRMGTTAEDITKLYDSASPFAWTAGTVVLWVAAALSLVAAFKLFNRKMDTAA